MEPQKKLKLIPLHQFFKIMDTPGKVFYLMLYAMMTVSVVFLMIAVNDPSRWVVDVEEFHAVQQETVPLREYTRQYRSMGTEIAVWQEDVTYYATPMTPKGWIVILFAAMQVIGWGFLLTAASYVKNFIAYVAFFLYAMAIFLSGAFEILAPGNSIFFNIGLGVLIFVPAFLFQQGIFNWRFAFRLPVFTLVTALPFSLVYIFRNWVGLHAATVSMFPILVVVAILYTVFVAKDLSQMVFFAGSNLKRQNWRLTPMMFLAVLIPLGCLCFVMMHNAMGWEFLAGAKGFPLRPLHVMGFLTLLMPGLNQNLSLVVKEQIDNRSFSILITSVGLVAMSTLFLHVGLGEYLFGYAFDRLFGMLLFFGFVFHSFYMFYNFSPLLRARLNLYFLTMMPKRLLFVFVVAAMVVVTLSLDASEGMKTQRIFQAVAFNRNADHELLEGRFAEASAMYHAAASVAEGTVKGNYNLAMLLMRMDGDLLEARERLQKASGFFPFAPAWINLGNLELSEGAPKQAKYFLKEGLSRMKDPHLSNNLALVHVVLDEPDSAILAMKQALLLDPDNPDLYSNMGRIYLQYGKVEDAKKFFKEGLQLPGPGPALVSNALFLNMIAGTDLRVSDSLLADHDIKASRTAQYNFAVERYKRRDYEGATKLIDSLLVGGETPDVLLLDGMLRFERGDIEGSISRMAYMDVNHPTYKPFTNHFLGVAFFGVGVPEMAADYFALSVANGRKDDLLNQARMEIDRGAHSSGFLLLNQARTEDTTLMAEVAREEALLQIANGEYFFASLGFDLQSLSVDEWTRAGIYAGMKGNRPAALEAFRHAIEKDSSAIEPYLEMGRISVRLKDSLALENLEAGLKKNPKHVGLQVEWARASMQAGRIPVAETKLLELQKAAAKDPDVQLLQAEITAAKGDTASALKQYKALRDLQPLDAKLVIGISRIMRARRMDFDGQNLIAEVLRINPKNPEFWYELAHFERLLDRTEEVSRAAQKAIQLSPDPLRAKEISTEFDMELKAFPPDPSLNN